MEAETATMAAAGGAHAPGCVCHANNASLKAAIDALREASKVLEAAAKTAASASASHTGNTSGDKLHSSADVLDAPACMKATAAGRYLHGRYVNSTLRKYFEGVDIEPEDADNAVNTLTLVAALVLTIPFGLLGTFGHETWEWISDSLDACTAAGHDVRYSSTHMFQSVFDCLNATIYSWYVLPVPF
jgi:hypothetical protein